MPQKGLFKPQKGTFILVVWKLFPPLETLPVKSYSKTNALYQGITGTIFL
jgi:hypothetical protein